MASTRAGLKIEGGLYEAISRGNKDTFFFNDDPEKKYYEDFQKIINGNATDDDKLKELRPLEKAIFNNIMAGNLPQQSIVNLKDIHKQVFDTIQALESNVNP